MPRVSVAGLLLFASIVQASDDPDESGRFGPGVRIDWKARAVELDAEVVLREGPLELVACSPQTREHESILRVRGRPMHIFQALGLIGLTPGSPVRYDEDRRAWRPPTGEALAIGVRCAAKGHTAVRPIEHWLRHTGGKQIPGKVDWVFAGSRSLENGKFGADLDGTVLCVVDFDTALMTVGDLHSADNEALWLEANEEAIPPVGTACVLEIRAAREPPMALQLDADGTLRHGGEVVSVESAARRAIRTRPEAEGPALILEIDPGVSGVVRQRVLTDLQQAGLRRGRIEVHTSGKPPEER